MPPSPHEDFELRPHSLGTEKGLLRTYESNYSALPTCFGKTLGPDQIMWQLVPRSTEVLPFQLDCDRVSRERVQPSELRRNYAKTRCSRLQFDEALSRLVTACIMDLDIGSSKCPVVIWHWTFFIYFVDASLNGSPSYKNLVGVQDTHMVQLKSTKWLK